MANDAARPAEPDQRVHFAEAAIVAQTVLHIEPSAVSAETAQQAKFEAEAEAEAEADAAVEASAA